MMLVSDRSKLLGTNLRIAFVMRSSQGTFFLCRFQFIDWTVSGVVKSLNLLIMRFLMYL